MRNIALSRVLPFIYVPLILWGGLRIIYYGSLTRSCIYTEKKVRIKPDVAESKLLFIGKGMIISEPYREFKCLAGFKDIKAQIVPYHVGPQRDDGSQIDPKYVTAVTADSKLQLSLVNILSVTKHGILTPDSGRAPIEHLILQDQDGLLYEIPTVYLGINSDEELLKMRMVDGTEQLLTADSILADR